MKPRKFPSPALSRALARALSSTAAATNPQHPPRISAKNDRPHDLSAQHWPLFDSKIDDLGGDGWDFGDVDADGGAEEATSGGWLR
ncbi:hypothetical protein E2542_SST18996 [Spatholobus suberectus]|nr:hypothetical protein E2542_SST18996 [Spatholobus suberectus]